MSNKINYYLVLLLITLINAPGYSQKIEADDLKKISNKTISSLIGNNVVPSNILLTIDSALVDKDNKILELYFSKELTYLPIREEWLRNFETIIRSTQKRRIRKHYDIVVYSAGRPVSYYIPNVFREIIDIDSSRLELRTSINVPHVINSDFPSNITKGLQNKHIAIWGGHGRYFSKEDSLWQWQRPNLFTTVEDLLTYSYVVPYIMPMLENAGANIYYPKERDTQLQELVIDYDTDKNAVQISEGVRISDLGFKLKSTYSDYENPFLLGSHHEMDTRLSSNKSDSIIYKVSGVDKGLFAVYVSYSKSENSVNDVEYKIYHEGGETTFSVNQEMGFGTWVYLGHFSFGDRSDAKIVVSNNSINKGVVTSDAIKIGGGFNRIERSGTLSDRPAYMTAGRYYLQYAGMPDSSVYTLTNGQDDYKDDYKSRGEWVNYLIGQPYCSNRDSSLQGLNIPIDLSLAFHTDAGTTKTDSVIGTLTIHSTYGLDGKRVFFDGRSRFASRDLADVVQTEIIKTIHGKYNADWVRRAMWDKQYSEPTYPNVPSMLVELLSHQNFGDMKYGLDPNFKFDVSRAIYKGVLKYLASQKNQTYVVTPLPINSFAVNYKNEQLQLSWEQTIDKDEVSASADAYIVYTKIGDGGFDNGVLVNSNKFVVDDFDLGKQYSFKVKAVNKGGVSFDSEILSACIFDKTDSPILIVNAFDKISAPEFFDTDSLGGFANWKKSAISSGADVSYVGNQYNFDKTKPWETNPLTGHGASYSDEESSLTVGNTFDYVYVHGNSFIKHNLSYVSTSIKAFDDNASEFSHYNKMDIIYGKQSTYNSPASTGDYSVLKEETRNSLSTWLAEGKSLLISGAFVASDVFLENKNDTVRSTWVRNNLNYDIVTDKSSVSGAFYSDKQTYNFVKKATDINYELRSVDALNNYSEGNVLFKYEENNYSAGVYSIVNNYNVLVLGFPLESLAEDQGRIFHEIIETLDWK